MTPQPQTSKRRSISTVLGLSVALAALIFIACFILIFLYAMFNMFDKAEKKTLQEQTARFERSLQASLNQLPQNINLFLQWPATAQFVEGTNPVYTQDFWIKNKLMQRRDADLVSIFNTGGDNLFTQFYNFETHSTYEAPDGFTDILSGFSKQLLNSADQQRKGFFVFNNTPYYIASKTIISPSSGKTVGVFFFGRKFDQEDMEEIAEVTGIGLNVFTKNSPQIKGIYDKLLKSKKGVIEVEGPQDVFIYKMLPGYAGDRSIVTQIKSPRTEYLEGMSFTINTGLVLALVILFFILTLFIVIRKFIVGPLTRLSKEIGGLASASDCVNEEIFLTQEFHTLATSVNTMFKRLLLSYAEQEKTKVSVSILENILNSMDTYVYVADPQTDKILFINEKMRKDFNLKPEDGVGSTCWKVFQKDQTEKCSFCPIYKLAQNPAQEVKWEELSGITGKYYANTDRLIEWVGGKKAHLHHRIDITQRKASEDTLKKRVGQQQLMTDISRIFISEQPIEQQSYKALEKVGAFMGLTNTILCKYHKDRQEIELVNKWLSPNIKQNAGLGTKASFKEGNVIYDTLVKNGEQVFTVEDTQKNPTLYQNEIKIGVRALMAVPIFTNGNFWGLIQFESSAAPVTWTDSDRYLGRLMGSIFSGAITRAQVEVLLNRMASIVNSSPQYISCVDTEGNFTYFNPATMQITGREGAELNQMGVSVFGVTKEKKDIIIDNIVKQGKYNFELQFKSKDGKDKIMSFSSFVIPGGKEDIGNIGTDITAQRHLEKEIIQAKETAEQASSAKGDFLARMSHEIRTPINAILGMTNIAKGSGEITKKDYCLEKIDTASQHLLGLINDILDMSKIEANKLELLNSEFDLEKMLVKVTNVANYRIDQKKQNLIVTIDKNVPTTVIGDELRLNQVITNLLTNATKFTPELGTIKLSVRKIDEDGTLMTLRISVEDNGIGISDEQKSRLFKSFEQADGTISRKFGGTGLGLAISKSIVELMGGAISVESEPNKGSTFTFTIKVHKGSQSQASKLDKGVNIDNIRILAVDDSEEIREYFLNVMGMLSLKCDVAADGEEALQLIQKNADAPYDIIFVDWMMPGMNGVELAKKIKENKFNKSIIIMISVSEWSEIEEEATKAGIDRFIGKPLFPSTLINAINECTTGAVSHAKETAELKMDVTKPNLEGHTLLVAEDVDINREIMEAFLEGTNVKIDFAFTGKEALDKFAADQQKYSAILMDIQMPEMDGLEATQAIRALNTEKANTIPIIAMTANVFAEDIQKCFAAGMNDHLGKPVNLDSMFSKLRTYLPQKHGVDTVAHDIKSAGFKHTDYSRFMPFIDIHDGLSRVANNKALYIKLLNRFEGNTMAAELINSINAADYDAVIRAAHTIKGVAANLGLTQLKNISLKIESQAKVKIEIAQISGLIHPFNETMSTTLKLIKDLSQDK
ncbi:PAS domain S-box-containing protein [Elusimicrobium simillimum]|uniref:response regulator n=1 Tax=Elusimicrobium simillimum TaxID=3143438 RepID=UPI003C6F79A0